MSSTLWTRNAILKGVCAIYLVAFMSLYMQIPGLYGPEGVLPAHVTLEDAAGRPVSGSGVVWLRSWLGLSTQRSMELLAVSGALLALLGVVLQCFRTSLVFATMLVMYGSLMQVGQLFLWYQWDTLLMEAGLLCALLAPLFPWQRSQPADALGLFLLRWLLFRVSFSSGLLKLLSRSPNWWGLTALETVFESHWLPTPGSWAAHQLPAWVLRLALVAVYVIEIAVPILFFAPVRRLRLFAFWAQVVLQLAAMVTGNCSFYNLLIVVLCLSLVDDDWLRGRRPATGGVPGVLSTLATFAVYAALLLGAVALFEVRLDYGGVAARPAFSKAEFETFARRAVPLSIAAAAAAFLLSAAEALTSALMDSSGCCRALDAIWKTLVSVVVCAVVFGVSLVPFSALDAATQQALPPALRESAAALQRYGLLGEYGLYRDITGAGGRPEVIIEGAYTVNGPWKEIQFKYKPGDVLSMPPVVFPHQPRLDWQMWYAAAGDYHGNPWLTSLAHRLLQGQPEVIRLLDAGQYPFSDKPPKYVRALKYKYKFTGWRDGSRWWQRSADRQDYLPIYTVDHKPLLEYLASLKIIDRPEKEEEQGWLTALLKKLRAFFDHWEPVRLLWALLLACWAVDLSRGRPWYF